jgi:5,10-methylene-tetrahydrofolate dehydrogenase/methenyl tetrahydrofolate cyclohydrolase
MVKPEWVKKGAVVMNVGTTFLPEKKELQPDVDRRVQQVRKQ